MNINKKINVARALLLATTAVVFSGCNSGSVAASPTPTPSPSPAPSPTPVPTPTPTPPPTESINHVLYIGLDGVTADALRKIAANSQNESSVQQFFDASSFDYGIYAGGNTELGDSVATWSAPGWTTLLTGYYSVDSSSVSYPYTSIMGNPSSVQEYTQTFTGPNSIFNVAGTNHVMTYAFGDWDILQAIFNIGKKNASALPVSTVLTSNSYQDYTINDSKIYSDTLSNIINIKGNKSSLTFTYFGAADEAGHEYGYDDSSLSTQYMLAVNTEIKYTAKLYKEIEARRESGENWMVIVTSDHGGTLSGNHGNRSWKEKQIFALINDNKTNLPKHINGQYQGQGAVATTVLNYLGVHIGKEYRSAPIYSSSTGTLQSPNGNYYLKFTDMALNEQDLMPIDNVTWPGDLNDYRNKIKFAVQDESNIYFFLNNNQFITFNTPKNQLTSLPQDINDNNWQGLAPYANDIKFGVSSPNTNQIFFFLNDGTYLASNLTTHQLQHQPYGINGGTWPGLEAYADKLQSAMGLNNERIYFFLTDHTYIVYDTIQDKIIQEPEPINDNTWPGLEFANYGSKFNQAESNEEYNLFVPWSCSSTLFFVFLPPAYLD